MYHLSVIMEIYDLRLQITILKEKLKLSSNYMGIEENFITVYGQMREDSLAVSANLECNAYLCI